MGAISQQKHDFLGSHQTKFAIFVLPSSLCAKAALERRLSALEAEGTALSKAAVAANCGSVGDGHLAVFCVVTWLLHHLIRILKVSAWKNAM